MYLRTHSPYLDSYFPYSKSQNIIRVNLLGNYSTSYYYIVNFLFTYILGINSVYNTLVALKESVTDALSTML